MVVEAEPREFGNTELFAEDARRVVVLKNPILEPRLNATDAIGKRILGCVEKSLRTREQGFSWTQQLEFVAQIPKSASGKILRRLLH